jgi:hypothetical protein
MTNQPPKLLEQVTDALRLRYYAYRTEQQYLHCIRRYLLFHNKCHPADMGAAGIDAFLAHLAVYDHVAPFPKTRPSPPSSFSIVMSSNNPSKHLLPTRNPFLPKYPPAGYEWPRLWYFPTQRIGMARE